MTDSELLELAAKAAGHDFVLHTGYDDENDEYKTRTWIREPERLVEWNPLKDDGDALRLAVNLGLVIEIGYAARGFLVVRTNTDNWKEFREAWGNDPYAATRRAIVRAAAAAIGEQMK